MQRTPQRDTRPEILVRSLLHRSGLRFRVHARIISSIRMWADISFPRQRVAIFIDGCFWHGCPEHCQPSKSNVTYWRDKLKRNRARDRRTTTLLQSLGWTVLRYWEHEPPSAVARDITKHLR
jgi:DNA mismatch endonuclease (patch repair protein)